MRKLTLIRHGKSSWDDSSLSDWERPLKIRGKKDALLIGNKLIEKRIIPDKIVSSSAKRAYDSAKQIAECLKYPERKITITDDIYLAGTLQLVQLIQNLKDKWKHVFLFGHNPYFTELSNLYGNKTILNLPTTGVYQISFKCDKWADISLDNGENTYFLTPKQLK
ncbi:MAG: histidine phosphatase family protein [Candidatus Neomarinimicrobiota bacterium]